MGRRPSVEPGGPPGMTALRLKRLLEPGRLEEDQWGAERGGGGILVEEPKLEPACDVGAAGAGGSDDSPGTCWGDGALKHGDSGVSVGDT